MNAASPARAAIDADADLDVARRVFHHEAAALRAMGDGLDGRFTHAVDLLAGVTGRVVLSGIGKSGHVARKIAATLASTGTPALFVHPTEASHGDLGMIAPRGDAVIALSKSGEGAEFGALLSYCKRHAIPLIAVTARERSTLAEMAHCTLLLPAAVEVCPLGLAPTTSTTMMMALGDALAVALLERRGFTAEDFQVLHPGGQLGRQLLRVGDLMHVGDAMPLTTPATLMAEAILTMTEKSFGCVGVVDAAGGLIGVITDGDLRRHMSPELLARPAGDVMTPGPKTIRPRALVAEALGLMSANAITSLFADEDGAVAGIIHVHDCLRAGIS